MASRVSVVNSLFIFSPLKLEPAVSPQEYAGLLQDKQLICLGVPVFRVFEPFGFSGRSTISMLAPFGSRAFPYSPFSPPCVAFLFSCSQLRASLRSWPRSLPAAAHTFCSPLLSGSLARFLLTLASPWETGLVCGCRVGDRNGSEQQCSPEVANLDHGNLLTLFQG